MRHDDGIPERSPTQFLADDLRARLSRRTEVAARNGRLTGLFCHDLPRYGVMSEAGMADLMGVTLGQLHAAMPLGVAVSTVRGGWRVTRAGRKWVLPMRGDAIGRPVICLDTGERFKSVQAAATAKGMSRATLRLAILQRRAARGLRFKFADAGKVLFRATRQWGRPVQCVETGEVYATLSVAVAAVNSCDNGIHRAIRTGGRAKGFHWRYAEAAKEAA